MAAVTQSAPLTAASDELLALALSRPLEALAAARQVLAQHPQASQAAIAHQAAGVVHRDFGDIDEAIVELKAALHFARKAGALARENDILASLGVAWLLAGQTRRGMAVIDTVLDRSSGVLAGRILIRRAYALWVLGQNADALRDAQAATGLLSGAGDPVWEARAVHHRATMYFAMGDVERADRDYARAEALYAECGQHLDYASARQERAVVAHARGDLPTALAHLDHAQSLLREVETFDPETFVNKCTVLLAAGLARDAMVEAEAAIATIERGRGSPAWHAELLYSAALAATAVGDLAHAERRSTSALRLFRKQQRPWWAARAVLVVLHCRFTGGDRSAALLQAARRVTARLDDLDPARAVDAHLLTGRLALARGRRDEAGRHLRSAASARPWSPPWVSAAASARVVPSWPGRRFRAMGPGPGIPE